MATEARTSTARSTLAGKRKKLLARVRKAVSKAQASAQAGATTNMGPAAKSLQGEIAGLRREVAAAPGADADAAARALSGYEKSLAAIVKASRASDPTQAIAELKSGYLALAEAKRDAKKAGHGWAL